MGNFDKSVGEWNTTAVRLLWATGMNLHDISLRVKMSYVGYQTRVAAQASVNERVISKEDLSALSGAILAWAGLMTIMYNSFLA